MEIFFFRKFTEYPCYLSNNCKEQTETNRYHWYSKNPLEQTNPELHLTRLLASFTTFGACFFLIVFVALFGFVANKTLRAVMRRVFVPEF